MMRKGVESGRWSMTLLLPKKRQKTKELVLLERVKGRRPMEKTEKPKVERLAMEEGKKKRKGSDHTAAQKCRAVLSVWTEKGKPGEICRELGVAWSLLNQWQERAMEGMLLALQRRNPVMEEKTVALNSRLAVLLERKSKRGGMKGLEGRLARLRSKTRHDEGSRVNQGQRREMVAENKI
jgi:transposase-like protein